MNLDRAVLLEQPACRDLDVGGDADAELPDVAAIAPSGLLASQLVVPGDAHRLVEGLGVLPHVVVGAGDGRERELVGGQEVLPADLDRIDVELVGGHVEDALEEGGGLGTARTAVGAGGGRVRGRAHRVELDLGDAVHALRHRAGEEGQEAADVGVGAGLGDDPAPHADDRAVALQAHLDVLDLPPAVAHRDHVLGAALGPLHRATQLAGDRGRDGELGVHAGLGAEAASDRGCDHAHLLGLEPDRGGQRVAHAVRALGRDPHGEGVAAVVHSRLHEDAVGLHGHGGEPLVQEATLHDDVGPVEHARVLAEVELDGEVRAVVGEEHRGGVLERGLGVDDGGQGVVVDDHELGGVDRLAPRLGDDGRHDVADESHRLRREGRAGEDRRDHGEALERREPEVGGRVHGGDARHRGGIGDVDRLDPGVGDGRADEGEVEEPLDGLVVEVRRLADEDARVLGAADRVPEDGPRSRHGPGI
jgi:hypothetical protein